MYPVLSFTISDRIRTFLLPMQWSPLGARGDLRKELAQRLREIWGMRNLRRLQF